MDSERNSRLYGIAASPGIAIGEVRVVERSHVVVFEKTISGDDVAAEVARLDEGFRLAREELRGVREDIALGDGKEYLHVIDAHLLILDDVTLVKEVVSLIEEERINAEAALRRTVRKFKELFSGMPDEYLRERGRDVETVLERVLRNLAGKPHPPLPTAEGKIIIVAHDLSPSDVLQIDTSKVIGFITDLGGKTAHTSILARSLGIPAVVGIETATTQVTDGAAVILDGSTGVVELAPSPETFRDYLRRKQHEEYVEKELLKLRDLPAETPDGHLVHLQGNAEFPEEVQGIRRHGGEGIGLLRTELLFMNRPTLPDEEEQYRSYVRIVADMAPHPVSIRTLDIGGDKLTEQLHLEEEMNPALGVRGVRLLLATPEVLRAQLRAILRAGAHGSVRLFLPMVSGIGEVREARAHLAAVKEELRREGAAFDPDVKVGIMIEVPSAVLTADQLAREVDFFSVGTNDLIQYTIAIDRTNEHLSHLYEPLHPAILRSLKMVVDAAHAAGIPACMCGEMAGEPLYLPVLLGLGFDELSMNALSIPRVKNILRRCPKREAEAIAARVLDFSTAAEVESFLKTEITSRFSESFD